MHGATIKIRRTKIAVDMCYYVAYTPQCTIWCANVEKSKQTLLYLGGGILKEKKRCLVQFEASLTRTDQLWGPSSPQLNGHQGSYPGLKRPGFEINHLIPSSAEINKEGSYTPPYPIYSQSMDRHNFTLPLPLLRCYKEKALHVTTYLYLDSRNCKGRYLTQ
jgi:hypothetical protein